MSQKVAEKRVDASSPEGSLTLYALWRWYSKLRSSAVMVNSRWYLLVGSPAASFLFLTMGSLRPAARKAFLKAVSICAQGGGGVWR